MRVLHLLCPDLGIAVADLHGLHVWSSLDSFLALSRLLTVRPLRDFVHRCHGSEPSREAS